MSSELAVEATQLALVPSPDGRRIIPITPLAADGTMPTAGKCGSCPTDGCGGLTASCIDPDKGAGCCCLACGVFW